MPATLPPITTNPTTCVPREGTDCPPDTWFCMSKWSPFYYDGEIYRQVPATPGKREPRQLVFTPRFMIDRDPVTNEAYAAYVRETGKAPPPDRIDDAFPSNMVRPVEPQPTGWSNGAPEARRLKHPVVGLTRIEAQAYCEHRGGHLPTAVEILRAGQYNAPLTYRFPWGTVFPFEPVGSMRVAPGFSDNTILNAMPPLSDVNAISGDKATFGTRGLATNVAEWLASCEEELREKFADNEPLVYSPAPFAARCKDAVLTTNFPSSAPNIMGQRILALQDERDATTTHYLGRRLGTTPSSLSLELLLYFPHLPSRPPVSDPAGNDVRNFRVGFRCAYEAP